MSADFVLGVLSGLMIAFGLWLFGLKVERWAEEAKKTQK